MFQHNKNRKIAAALAFSGILLPGLHKFYLGQYRWGFVYLLLSGTPISRVASALEGLWYLFHDHEEFSQRWGFSVARASQVGELAEALRQLEALRQEGLISEYEFEQKRRHLVNQM
ncbi:MAG: NINE protein [Pegethrix bostrychoides GSE-TBD4-15B]|jgi:TM2 domain-containing membrane protein YozV|uniref:NINE protein n=1 Tax=Pegethrix bostrychoides GSE-TBD4-15B TaxID=2839662 RepID=A0A951P6I1_9CYAN|nr:NINE protein [Pegethrix bostrychoides GSE-TBD4-15B]